LLEAMSVDVEVLDQSEASGDDREGVVKEDVDIWWVRRGGWGGIVGGCIT